MEQETWQGDQLCWPRTLSGRNYDRFMSYEIQVTRSKAPFWRQFIWRKLKKGKTRMQFRRSKSMRFAYDPLSYSQNFDHGTVYADTEDLSRSFSARFAVASRCYEKNILMV